MPRVKKVPEEVSLVVEGLNNQASLLAKVPRPNEGVMGVSPTVVEEDQSEADSVIERIVNKIQKVVTIKKQLSEKQQSHLSTLAAKKKGKRYVEQVSKEDIEDLPVKTVKKEKKKKIVVVESSESEEEEIVPLIKPKKKTARKQPVVFPNPIQEQIFQSRFKKSLF